VQALELEATGDQTAAARALLSVLTSAVESTDPFALARAVSASDALISRDPISAVHSSLLDRTSGVDARSSLEASYARAKGPFGKGVVARVLTHLAEVQGEPAAAEKWRARTGCARSVAMFGPLSWSSVLAATEPDALAEPNTPMPTQARSEAAMMGSVKRVDYTDRGCFIQGSAVSDEGGAREVLVDVDVAAAGKVGVVLRASSAAVLRAQGRTVVTRGYDEGGEVVSTYGTFSASAGTVRLAVRLGQETRGQGIELDVFGADGAPLPTHAPAAGSVATARVTDEAEIGAALGTPADTLVVSAFALASGRGRRVERLLTEKPLSGKEAALANMLLARALLSATDLPPVERAERQRAVVEKVLAAWPSAWEAVALHASLAAQRKGAGEARLEALSDLDAHKAGLEPSGAATLALFEALLSAEAKLYDRANAALERSKGAIGKSGTYSEVVDRAVRRTPREQIDVSCNGVYKADFGCYYALTANAEWDRARAELARLRAIRGAPKALLALDATLATGRGDPDLARKVQADMLPGERSITLMVLADGDKAAPLDLARTATDSPRALLWSESFRNASPLAAFKDRAEAAVAKAKAEKGGDAATTILDREERYELLPSGVLHYVVFDVRKVSGTADVESNAQAGAPMVYGRDASRILRRRILKKDGRVLTPEQTPHAQQQHADLAQLETGDAVEAIYEGYSVPGDNGVIGFDSPDLLPARTAVKSAQISVTVPKALRDRLVAHPLLGAAVEKTEGDNTVLRFALSDAPVRRLEDGVPRMDRAVGVVFSSASWPGLARAIAESERALEGTSSELGALAALLAGDKTDREKIDHVVTLTGQRLKQSLPGAFTDFEGSRPSGAQSVQLRTYLASHEGSRTFMAKKVLGLMNIPSEIVVAESEPFSANPQMVPHMGRFLHPLLLVHPQSATGDKRDELWLDLDVPGPPLPAGRVSPELRGKSALFLSGEVKQLPAQIGESDPDEIDLRLTLDKNGDAKGDLTILLRGRTAQDIAEAFELVVGDERERVLRGVVLGWVPYASVDSVSLSSSEGSAQVAVRASLTVPGYAQAEGHGARSGSTKPDTERGHVLPGLDPVHYVFPRPYSTTLSSTYASQAGRKSAFAINRALLFHVHRRVELPDGAKTTRVPGPFDAKRANLKASRAVSVQKSAVEEDFKLSIPSGTVSAADYGDFVTQLHNADDAFLTSIHVTLPR
jgi:hypothetical protein